MKWSVETIAGMEPSTLRKQIPEWLADHVELEPDHVARMCQRVAAELAEFDDAMVKAALLDYGEVGNEYRIYPANVVARRIARRFFAEVTLDREISGVENLVAARARGPVLLLSNHVSYVDSQFTDLLLADADAPGRGLADAMVFVAGPKVYLHPLRRMAAMGLSTLPTAQSSRLDHNRADLSPRDIARIAIETVRRTRALAREGAMIVLYGEGGRSRTGRLEPFLRAVGRYPEPGAQLVPLALSGTGQAFPLHGRQFRAAPIRLAIGEAVEGDDPVLALEKAWHHLAELLPSSQQPPSGTAPTR